MAQTRHRGRWTLEHRFASAWHYLPVEVPPGASGLRVELDYERNGAVVDLGCIGPGGFRGWSGGARRSFVITADAATPGYLPGELEPGTWQVILGLHQLSSAGTSYRLLAEVTSTRGALQPEPVPGTPPLPDRPPGRRARSRFCRDHRPQHGQPSCGTPGRLRSVRHHARARPGSDDRSRSCG